MVSAPILAARAWAAITALRLVVLKALSWTRLELLPVSSDPVEVSVEPWVGWAPAEVVEDEEGHIVVVLPGELI